jgi:hypothetical protein
LDVPFFWDGTFFSEIAVNYFSKGFDKIISPDIPDTGGFPMYSIYLAGVWKVFGKTLAVSHLAMIPFIFSIVIEYYKLFRKFLSPQMIPIALLLLICEPCLSTQSILMGYDILMIAFFLISLNALLDNKKWLFSISFTLLLMCSMRGIMLGCSLILLDLIINEFKTFSFIKKFFPGWIILSAWSYYHFKETGWYFFAPEREYTDEAWVSPILAFKKVFFIGWKLVDLGRILLWIFIFSYGIYAYKKKPSGNLKQLYLILFVPLGIVTFWMSPLSNPIGPKYFIVFFLLLTILVCFLLQTISNKKVRLSLASLFIISLLSGNFWLYPERLGNSWDASLKVLPYFDLKDEMDEFILSNKIPSEDVGTQFPLIADKRYSHLSDDSFKYTNVWSGPLENYSYFLQTNVINTDISYQVEEVKKTWVLIKSIKKGQVYFSLYKNPSMPDL